ncbi:MAG: ankyrin repeat domain-containing protein [Alphaproteobacteria bacterium]|nr:MAG: ankyrin repeat domain-containing protein [Alphaproteobacteria bacterium]
MSHAFNPWVDKEPELVVQFRHAVTHGMQGEALEMLLKGEADVNLPDHNGRTPLYFAGMYGQAAMIDLLVENGADILKANNFGETALTVATNVSKDAATIGTAKKRIAEAEERETWRHPERWSQHHIEQVTVLQHKMLLNKRLRLK